MTSLTIETQTEFDLFNLLQLPIALFSLDKKELIFINDSFVELYDSHELSSANDLCSSNNHKAVVSAEQELALLDELAGFYQDNASNNHRVHVFTIEFESKRRKYIYEYTAYQKNAFIIVQVQDVTKLKKSQFLLNSSNAMLEKYSNEMFTLAHTDLLTKTANRRALFAKFEQLTTESAPLEFTISILDIDYFKKFNDSYGHEFGDYVLTVFCDHIKALISPISFFARIGGEEFCLIQEQSSKSGGTNNIQNILQSIKDIQLETPTEKQVNISFSAGIAEYGKDGTTLDSLLNNADKALYYAKQNGRSCVIPFSTDLFEKRADIIYAKSAARNSR